MKNGKAMITKKRILEFVANRYFAIGSTGESGYPESLYYVTDFLNNLWLDEAKKGSAVYNRGGINNLSIDYGDPDQDYYVQFSFLWNWDRYTIEMNGETIDVGFVKLCSDCDDDAIIKFVEQNET